MLLANDVTQVQIESDGKPGLDPKPYDENIISDIDNFSVAVCQNRASKEIS